MIKNRYNRSCTSLVTVTLFCAGVMFSPVSFAAENKKPDWLPPSFGSYHGADGESYKLTKDELAELTKKTEIGNRQGRFRDAQRKAKRGIVEKIEEQDIENKIYSVKFFPSKSIPSVDNKIKVEVDFQYNGKRGLAKLDYDSEYFPDSNAIRPRIFSDVAVKPGRQKLTANILIYPQFKINYSLTNIKLQLKDTKDTVIIEKKLDEVIDWQAGKQVSIRTDDKDGLHTAVRHAALILDNATSESELHHAKKILDKVIYDDPDNREAYIELARFHMKQRVNRKVKFKSAEQILKDGLSVDPNYANTRVLLGYVYTHQQRYAEAEREFELAEKLGTDNLWLYTNWGELYTKTDQKDKAYRYFDKVIKTGRTGTRNDRALTSGYRLYLSYLKKKYDVNRMGDVHAMRVANLKGEGCYQSEYAAHLVTYERELVESKVLAKSANKASCRRNDFVNKVLAQVLLVRSLYAKYDGNDSADKDYRRSRALYNDQARIIADLSEKNNIGDLYQRLKQRRGLSVDTKGANGITALAYCVNELRYTCVENLLSHGASPNEIGNKEGWSMLMLAVLQNNKPIIKRLLIAGADPNYATKEGVTAHILAGYIADKDVAAMLKAASRI